MTKKTKEQHEREAAETLRPLMEQAAAMPGVMDMIAVLENFDTSNQGAATYARTLQNVVYFTSSSSTR